MNLIIVESPTKARTLSRFLGKDYRVEATMGHIRDLPEDNLGINIEKNFEPQYVLSSGKKETINNLKKSAQGADAIYIASDPDREGEAIAWHVAYILKASKESKVPKVSKETKNLKTFGTSDTFDTSPSSISRITFHEITKSAIDEALKKPGKINLNLVEAQTARRILDRLVGYKLSPLLWKKVRRGLSAGRVQSVAVRLIVEKEREIEKFVPIEYWEIEALLETHQTKENFWSKLVKINSEKAVVGNEKDALQIQDELKNSKYKVLTIEEKELKRNSLPPFTTSTLQQAASNRLGWSSKKTMNIAQSLYENGLITYHRTDSTNIAVSAINQARDYIKSNFGENYLPLEAKIYVTKSKSAQEAHEAVRPTDVSNLGEKWEMSREVGSGDEKKLYDLIWKRFLACQMNPEVAQQTTIDIEASGGSDSSRRSLSRTKLRDSNNIYLLETKGERQVFDGWRKLYQKEEDDEEQLSNGLPKLLENENLNLKEIKPTQKFTQPPARFNEASLIKTLEELGIGRPSTYAPTISTILERQYVEKKEKQFFPTSLGFAVNDFLVKYFSDILDYQFTAKMENDLDEIADGKMQRVPVLKEFYGPFSEKLKKVGDKAEKIIIKTEATGEKCPTCKEGNIVIRLGRFGKFLSCDRFPECKYRAPYILKVSGVKCPKCGSDIVFKKTKKGKGFYGCSAWPKCDFASWHKPNEDHPPAGGSNILSRNEIPTKEGKDQNSQEVNKTV